MLEQPTGPSTVTPTASLTPAPSTSGSPSVAASTLTATSTVGTPSGANDPARSSADAAWASFWVAVFALIATIVAALVAWRGYKKQSRQLLILEDEKQKEVPSKFALWIHWADSGYEVRYHNGSHLPVSNVWYRFAVDGEETKDNPLGNLGPTASPIALRSAIDTLTQMVGEIIWKIDEVAISESPQRIGIDPETLDLTRHELFTGATVSALWFTDSSGRKWLRNASGELTPEPNVDGAPPGYGATPIDVEEARRGRADQVKEFQQKKDEDKPKGRLASLWVLAGWLRRGLGLAGRLLRRGRSG
ncbi:hypothetical protein [Amycolatopsis sp. NPDC098790]|uniref:hypothetical protein n=1 Tax=Amycolatopsis sp. NPDC098790 TaxID=3363939 RepID=UPI00380637BC